MMIWIYNKKHRENRGDIESYEQFIRRNLDWWKANEHAERKRRREYYDHFVKYCNLDKILAATHNVAEVGPGPFGGMLEVCNLPANRKFFIDYVMKDLFDLNFIEWPQATYVDAPAEDIPLDRDTVDILLSYNAIDHGWDIWKCLDECVRISRRSYLCFDCRGDSEEQIKTLRNANDLDHYQIIKYEDVQEYVMAKFSKHRCQVTDLGTKSDWHVAVVIVEK